MDRVERPESLGTTPGRRTSCTGPVSERSVSRSLVSSSESTPSPAKYPDTVGPEVPPRLSSKRSDPEPRLPERVLRESSVHGAVLGYDGLRGVSTADVERWAIDLFGGPCLSHLGCPEDSDHLFEWSTPEVPRVSVRPFSMVVVGVVCVGAVGVPPVERLVLQERCVPKSTELHWACLL